MRARFWMFENGSPVRISLDVGQSHTYSRAEPTDEGYSANSFTVTFDGERVTQEWEHHGRDCDGEHAENGESWCAIDRLEAGSEFDGIRFPDWQKGRQTECYDQFAQLMNY